MAVIVDAGAPPGFRTPPHSPDAEQAVLGAILYRNDIFNAISGYLHAEHFYQPVHRRIYQSIEALVSAGKQADHITLLRAFKNDEELRQLDGTKYMVGLAELGMVSQLDAEHYARHVHDLAVKRRLIQLGEDLVNQAYDETDQTAPVDLLSRTEGLLRSLSAEVLDELQGIDLAAWDGAELPPLGWIVTDWMPRGDVTSLYGRGGAGKSFLAQLLGSCVQFGKPFLGLEIEPCQVLGVFCEDGWDDLLWRQQKIDRALEISWRDGRFPLWISRRGKVNALMTFEHGGLPRMTPLFAAIREKAKRIGARLIILDNVAHLYAGDEISRHEVTTFLNMFAGLAEEINGAVLLIGHPPAIEGKEYSGSTAWVNQVRALWTFEKSKTEDGKYLLKRFKCNRSGEDKLELVKDEITGVVRPDHPDFEDLETRRQREKRAGRCRQHILEHLDILNSRGDCASHSPNAKNYLPRLLKTSTCTAAFTRTRWQWLSRASLPMAGFPQTSRSAGVPTGTRSWAWLGQSTSLSHG